MNACHRTLSDQEVEQLHALELRALTSLAGIRDLRLYRDTHSTFEDYFRERFGWTLTPRFFRAEDGK